MTTIEHTSGGSKIINQFGDMVWRIALAQIKCLQTDGRRIGKIFLARVGYLTDWVVIHQYTTGFYYLPCFGL